MRDAGLILIAGSLNGQSEVSVNDIRVDDADGREAFKENTRRVPAKFAAETGHNITALANLNTNC